jgi:hypothetical protein
VLIDRKKTALVTDIALPLSQNLPKTEAQKITKYENLAMEIKNIWKLNVSTHHLVTGHQKLPTVSTEYRFNQKHLKSGAKAVLLQTCHTERKFLGHAP